MSDNSNGIDVNFPGGGFKASGFLGIFAVLVLVTVGSNLYSGYLVSKSVEHGLENQHGILNQLLENQRSILNLETQLNVYVQDAVRICKNQSALPMYP